MIINLYKTSISGSRVTVTVMCRAISCVSKLPRKAWSTHSLNDHSAKEMKQQIIIILESQFLDHYHYF